MDDGPRDLLHIMAVADPYYKVASAYSQAARLRGGCEAVRHARNGDNTKGIGPQPPPIHNSEFGNHHGICNIGQHRA